MTSRTQKYLTRRKKLRIRRRTIMVSDKLEEIRRKKELLRSVAKAENEGMTGLAMALRSRAYSNTHAYQVLLESYKQRILGKRQKCIVRNNNR